MKGGRMAGPLIRARRRRPHYTRTMSDERRSEAEPEPSPSGFPGDTDDTGGAPPDRADPTQRLDETEPQQIDREETGREPSTLSARSEIPFGLVFLLLLALLIAVFAVQNTQSVRIEFLVWDVRSPLAIVIIAVVVATTILNELLGLVFRRRRRRRIAERAELERLRRHDQG